MRAESYPTTEPWRLTIAIPVYKKRPDYATFGMLTLVVVVLVVLTARWTHSASHTNDLLKAIRDDDPLRMEAAIVSGADVHENDDVPLKTLLSMRRGKHTPAMLEVLLRHGVTLNQRIDGQTLLQFAIMQNQDFALLLIDRGASLAPANPKDMPLLVEAATFDQNKDTVACVLLDKGADVNARDQNGKTVLQIALEFNNWTLSKTLLDHGATLPTTNRQAFLRNAVQGNRTDIVKILLAKGIRPTVNESGASPLIAAVDNGNIQITRLLLEHGADPNIKDGPFPLLYNPVNSNRIEIVKLLLQHGANPNAMTNLRAIARGHNHAEMDALLASAGAKN